MGDIGAFSWRALHMEVARTAMLPSAWWPLTTAALMSHALAAAQACVEELDREASSLQLKVAFEARIPSARTTRANAGTNFASFPPALTLTASDMCVQDVS